MFGATCNAAPVTRSVDVGTAEAVATSAASPAPRCADGPSPGRSMRGATAAAAPGLALAAATELVLFFVDDDELASCLRFRRARHHACSPWVARRKHPVQPKKGVGGSEAAEPSPPDARDTLPATSRAP